MTLRVTSVRIMKGAGAPGSGFALRRPDVHPTQGFADGLLEATTMTAQDRCWRPSDQHMNRQRSMTMVRQRSLHIIDVRW
jgi:hypothetical protein